MRIIICENAGELGVKAAGLAAESLREAVAAKGSAYLLLSTGMSQFTTFEALVKEDVDWTKVEMFHLDEYIGLPESHPASFVKYLKERFTRYIPLKAAHFVNTADGAEIAVGKLALELEKKPIDVGLIGIGENTHIAFNDPPADFESESPYIVVTLDEACRKQQSGEGWFKTPEDVPAQAVTMTVKQILKCKKIISAVPYSVKADAIFKTLTADKPTPAVPATALRTHPDVTLFLDKDSASLIDGAIIERVSKGCVI